jgi:tetratricopeptide (TPR) repeat protein
VVRRHLASLALAGFVAATLAAGTAEARNPYCAGGIQYLIGGLRDKDKGLTEDYMRQMNKAVSTLEQCRAEDPQDFEAIGYLGWAYAEIDSAGPAGIAFQQAMDGLGVKGDKKKLETVVNNRDSYWTLAYNDGIAKIGDAQRAWPEYNKKPVDEADQTLWGEAQKSYDSALKSLTRASLIRPGHAATLRSLGSVYVFKGDPMTAQKVFENALKVAPGDTNLIQSLQTVRQQYAETLIDEKKFDEAIKYFDELIKASPGDANLYLGLGSAYFGRAQAQPAEARKPDFKAAGDAYAKAGTLRPTEADLPFNAAVMYQQAGEFAPAEAQWRKALAIKPGDEQTVSGLAATLTDLQKYDEATKLLREGLAKNPKNGDLHRQLGAVYNKSGNTGKSTEELLVYLSLRGTPEGDPAAAAKAAKPGSSAAGTLASMGAPDQVNRWTGDNQQYETWYYWSKAQAFHFKDGALAAKSDWSK